MKSFEKGWKIFVEHTVKIVHRQKILTSSVEIVHTPPSAPYLEDDFEIFAALFLQMWNFRVFLFLTFFAKSIYKVTRRDYVNWGTIVGIFPQIEISPTDGMCFSELGR